MKGEIRNFQDEMKFLDKDKTTFEIPEIMDNLPDRFFE
jgi:hypothetical protein